MTLVQEPPSPAQVILFPPINGKVQTPEHKTAALGGMERTLWGFQKAVNSQESPVVSHPV